MSSTGSSSSKALEAYIDEFEKTNSDASDYFCLPPSRQKKQVETSGNTKIVRMERGNLEGRTKKEKQRGMERKEARRGRATESSAEDRRSRKKEGEKSRSNEVKTPSFDQLTNAAAMTAAETKRISDSDARRRIVRGNAVDPDHDAEETKDGSRCERFREESSGGSETEKAEIASPVPQNGDATLKALRMYDVLYAEAIARWKAEKRKEKKKTKEVRKKEADRKMKSEIDRTRTTISPTKDFFSHYLDCVNQLQFDANINKMNKGKPPPSWIEGLSSIAEGGITPSPRPPFPSHPPLDQPRSTVAISASGRRPPPSWIDALSEATDGLAVGSGKDERSRLEDGRVSGKDEGRVEDTGIGAFPKPPSWVDGVFDDDDDEERRSLPLAEKPFAVTSASETLPLPIGVNSSLPPSAPLSIPSKTLPYREMLEHLFQRQDVRLRRLKLASHPWKTTPQSPIVVNVANSKTERQKSAKFPRSGERGVKMKTAAAAAAATDESRSSVDRSGNRSYERKQTPSDPRRRDRGKMGRKAGVNPPSSTPKVHPIVERGGEGDENTEILLTSSAYGRANSFGVEHHEEYDVSPTKSPLLETDRRLPSSANTNEAEIVSARLVDVDVTDDAYQRERDGLDDHLESELAGDRSWERLPNAATVKDPLLEDIMAKRSVEKLKNLLLTTQSHVFRGDEKENLELGHLHLARPPTAKPRSKDVSKELKLQPKRPKSPSCRPIISPQHHSTPLKGRGMIVAVGVEDRSSKMEENFRRGSQNKVEDTEDLANSLDRNHSTLEAVAAEDDDGNEGGEDADGVEDNLRESDADNDCVEEKRVAAGKVVMESTKALEMAFHHFGHLQSLFQQMSVQLTEKKRSGEVDNDSDVVSTVV